MVKSDFLLPESSEEAVATRSDEGEIASCHVFYLPEQVCSHLPSTP